MSEQDLTKVREILKQAFPPVGETRPRRDLWPDMLRRLDERAVRVPWFDWALLALGATLVLFFPRVIPALLYHL